jgi:glycosyltransferase involved in cell wall biosynthesis
MSNGQYISVIVVCRDEEEFIAACLDSILANDYPKDDFEIIVVDGMSDDGTRKIINEYIKKYPRISLLDNSRKFTSWALNIGIRAAKGDYIAFMGSHNLYDSQYLSKCVYNIKKYNADNVGGVWKILHHLFLGREMLIIAGGIKKVFGKLTPCLADFLEKAHSKKLECSMKN